MKTKYELKITRQPCLQTGLWSLHNTSSSAYEICSVHRRFDDGMAIKTDLTHIPWFFWT